MKFPRTGAISFVRSHAAQHIISRLDSRHKIGCAATAKQRAAAKRDCEAEKVELKQTRLRRGGRVQARRHMYDLANLNVSSNLLELQQAGLECGRSAQTARESQDGGTSSIFSRKV